MTAANQVAPATPHHARGMLLMLGSAACFIANVLLIRGITTIEAVNVWVISSARFAVGLVVIAAWFWREWQPSHLLNSRKLAERGLIGGVATIGFYYTVMHLGAGRATFINNTYLIWGALMAVLILRERLRPLLAVGSVGALLGLGLLTGAFATGVRVTAYDVVAVITAVASGYVVVTIRQLHATEHSATIFSAQCAYGLLACLLPLAWHLQPLSSLALTLLVIAGTCAAGGQLLMTQGFRDLSVAEGSLLQMVVPLGIAAGEAAFFGERFTAAELVGGGLILSACILPALRR